MQPRTGQRQDVPQAVAETEPEQHIDPDAPPANAATARQLTTATAASDGSKWPGATGSSRRPDSAGVVVRTALSLRANRVASGVTVAPVIHWSTPSANRASAVVMRSRRPARPHRSDTFRVLGERAVSRRR